MLQRAANNAYSWWWASHIRTKQSKWIEQNLQDMEGKVHHALKLIEEDGDSFAKRAEMYYKKRPELIEFVEETYRAYRALAERYDHLSTELQNANNTIASVFPEQVQLMEEEYEYNCPKLPSGNSPKIPKPPNIKDFDGLTKLALKKPPAKTSSTSPTPVPKSGLSKEEAVEEIDKLQKEILGLQTVKEFVKSSYERGVAKYWEIEDLITEKQEKVFNLQDEFSVCKVIEDGEARALMAEAALKSCEETLDQLQEKQEATTKDAKEESERIEVTKEKLKSLKHEFLPGQTDQDKPSNERSDENAPELNPEKTKEHNVDGESKSSLTVTEMTEKIDELVNKVISLETAVSSQDALINRMRSENDDLQSQITRLEGEKASLLKDADSMIERLRELEAKLNAIQDLNHNVEKQNSSLVAHFSEARATLGCLSGKLHELKLDEELNDTDSLQDSLSESGVSRTEEMEDKHGKMSWSVKSLEEDDKNVLDSEMEEKDDSNWQRMLLSGLEDREKILLTEYSTILRNYKDVRKQLDEVEKKNHNSLFDLTVELREMRSAIGKRDEEIQSLRQKLNLLHENAEGGKDLKDDNEKTLDLFIDQSANPDAASEASCTDEISEVPMGNKAEGDIKLMLVDEQKHVSPIEEKLQTNINTILDKNLTIWFKFCTSFQQMRKFKSEIRDLHNEISKLKEKEKNKEEGSSTAVDKSDVRAIYRHLREIQTELTVWLERSSLLKDELQSRFSSMCNIQEEIEASSKEGAQDNKLQLTNYEAAKLEGEILSMKQENKKVRDELQAGLEHVKSLHQEIDKTLARLKEEFELSGPKKSEQPQPKETVKKPQIPLRSFIFGTKHKKQKHSIFSCMNPAVHRK